MSLQLLSHLDLAAQVAHDGQSRSGHRTCVVVRIHLNRLTSEHDMDMKLYYGAS